MPTKYVKLKDFPQHRESPFAEEAVKKMAIVKKTQMVRPANGRLVQRVVSSDDQITGHTAFLRVVEVDEERFAKVYHAHLKAFWDMSKQGLRLFTYILDSLRPHHDEFYLIAEDCKAFTGYTSERSINEGIANLIELGIIAKSTHHLKYFINPQVFFNGNRIVFAKMLVKKEATISSIDSTNSEAELQDAIDDVVFSVDDIDNFERKSTATHPVKPVKNPIIRGSESALAMKSGMPSIK